MSNALAIAATTAALHNLLLQGIQALDTELTDLNVTTQPLDRARSGVTAAQLNLFLYQTVINAAWRNMDMPGQVRPGETGYPPLALNLYYLLTAYGRGDTDNDAVSHRVLGSAMSVLHDHPLLGADEIRAALKGNDLADQIERVRITPQPFSVEEISKLWTAFQTNYRLSAAYEATVVLIDSHRQTRTPLPVLTRGPGDSGVSVQANMIPPYPALQAVGLDPPTRQPVPRLGDTLKLTGFHLDGANIGVLFAHPALDQPNEVLPAAGATPTTLMVKLPTDRPDLWPAGFYTVAVAVQKPNETYRRQTNALTIAVAPQIATITPGPATHDVNGNATLTVTVTCTPQVRPDQRASLLLGSQEFLAASQPTATDTVTFTVAGVRPGPYFLRLRVDGVDSLLVKDYQATPPVFDPTQQVTVP